MSLPHELRCMIEAAHSINSRINAFTSLLSPADVISAYSSTSKGSLRGVTVAIKDVFCTKQLPTTAASRMLKDYTSPFDATVITRLRQSGALIHGKTNMDEFGMGSSNVHSHFGPTLNPSGPPNDSEQRVAGGSSGGSAAAVAAGLCDIALGTDTGGSTRLPAAYCGVAGLKPSYGLISRWGVLAYASSLDCVGLMAKKVESLREPFNVMSAFDGKDPTSAPQSARDLISAPPLTRTNLKGIRIGVPAEYFLAELSPTVLPNLRRVLQSLKDKGASLHSVSLPSTPLALGAYYVLACAEASSNLARYDGIRFGMRVDDQAGPDGKRSQLYAATRSAGFGAEVQKRILLGTYALSAEAFDNYFLQAQRIRKLIRSEFDSVFRQSSPLTASSIDDGPASDATTHGVDALIHPSAISTAPRLSDLEKESTTTTTSSPYASYTQDVLTVPASLAGLPALSVPIGRSSEDGWPLAAQVTAQWGSDDLVMSIGEAIEESVAQWQ